MYTVQRNVYFSRYVVFNLIFSIFCHFHSTLDNTNLLIFIKRAREVKKNKIKQIKNNF